MLCNVQLNIWWILIWSIYIATSHYNIFLSLTFSTSIICLVHLTVKSAHEEVGKCLALSYRIRSFKSSSGSTQQAYILYDHNLDQDNLCLPTDYRGQTSSSAQCLVVKLPPTKNFRQDKVCVCFYHSGVRFKLFCGKLWEWVIFMSCLVFVGVLLCCKILKRDMSSSWGETSLC